MIGGMEGNGGILTMEEDIMKEEDIMEVDIMEEVIIDGEYKER